MKNEYVGKSGKDTITGYAGTITGYAEYLTTEPHVLIESIDSSGRPTESWVSVKRLEMLA